MKSIPSLLVKCKLMDLRAKVRPCVFLGKTLYKRDTVWPTVSLFTHAGINGYNRNAYLLAGKIWASWQKLLITLEGKTSCIGC